MIQSALQICARAAASSRLIQAGSKLPSAVSGRACALGAAAMMWLPAFLPPALAEEPPAASASSFVVELGVARTEGKFGLARKTTIDRLTAGAKWLLPRGELSVSVPMLRLDGPGNIALAGARTSSDRIGSPIRLPPIGPGVPPIGGPPASGDPVTDTEMMRSESGLGDVVLSGEYYLLSSRGYGPWVSALLSVKTATGSVARGLGTGGTDVEPGISITQPLGPVDLIADAGYTWVGGSSDTEPLRNTTRFGAGLSMPLGADSSAYLYYEALSSAVRGFEDQRAVILGGSAAIGAERRWRLSASLTGGLSDTAEDFSVGLRLGYHY
jgi:hypothetical protein